MYLRYGDKIENYRTFMCQIFQFSLPPKKYDPIFQKNPNNYKTCPSDFRNFLFKEIFKV